jgi:hypothetical protein
MDLAERFAGVLEGTHTRDEVDRWAAQWVAAAGDPGVDDEVVWEGLTRLYGLDLRDLDGVWLASDDQIREWLNDVQR